MGCAASEHDKEIEEIRARVASTSKAMDVTLGDLLKDKSFATQNDREFAKEILNINGENMQWLDHVWDDDKEMVMAGMNSKCLGGHHAFMWASEKLRGDMEFVKSAMKIDGNCYKYVTEELKANKDFVLPLVKDYLLSMNEDFPASLAGDKELALAAIDRKDSKSYRALTRGWVKSPAREDKDVLAAAEKNRNITQVELRDVEEYGIDTRNMKITQLRAEQDPDMCPAGGEKDTLAKAMANVKKLKMWGWEHEM